MFLRNGGLAPDAVDTRNSLYLFNMVAHGQPFEGLKNIYAVDQENAPAFAFVAFPLRLWRIARLPSPITICSNAERRGRPENWTGVIIVQPATLLNDLSSVVNSLSVGFCDRQQKLVWIDYSVSF